MEDLAKINNYIKRIYEKCNGEDVQSSHLRDYYEVLMKSLYDTTNNIKQGKKYWSDFVIEPKKMSDIMIAPGVQISAFKIKYPSECYKFKGYWCWCKMNKKMYICINDIIFSGNCLNILNDDITPYKFHEHYNSKNMDYTNTAFYIPNEINNKSMDRRCLTNKMQYVPSTEDSDNKYIYRIGSAENLKSDLSNIDDINLRLFNDMTISHLLCLTKASSFKNIS